MRIRLLRVTFSDAQGEPYHTANLAPIIVRRMLARFVTDDADCPLGLLTYAAVQRRSRAVSYPLRDGGTALVCLAEDVEEAEPVTCT